MAPARCLPALPWYGEGEALLEEPLVVCGVGEIAKRTVQNAGRAFWDRFEEPLASASPKSKSKSEAKDGGDAEREKANKQKQDKKKQDNKKKEGGGLLKISDGLKGIDLYELLEIEEGASEDEIKKNWRKLVLVHHPDKIPDANEEQKQHFLIMQEAQEIVSDPDKRRRYESTLDFDDDIPTGFGKGKLANADFYDTFSPVFKRNGRFSNMKPVPDLGVADTDVNKVKAFYDFWWGFDSWRDPLAMAEKEECDLHNLEDAECREERRWMERENARMAKKFAREERDRIMDLVRTAEMNDPRMIAYKESVFKAKTAEKDRRAAAANAEKEQKEKAAKDAAEAADALRQVEDAKRAEEKKKRDEAKNIVKSARQRLRNVHRAAHMVVRQAVHVDQLQEVCLRLEADALDLLTKEVDLALKKDKKGKFTVAIAAMHREIEACGLTPIQDETVRGESSESTASGDEGPSEGDGSPQRELTPEEREKERLMQLEEEAKERERQERKAEEQRKKREKQRKEDEKRQAAVRQQEKKEKEALAKKEEKARQQAELKEQQAELQRQKQAQQREEDRLRAAEEEVARKQAHEEQLIGRAFEKDRQQRITVLEAYEDSMLDAALRTTLLQGPDGKPDVQLKLALSQVASSLPPQAANQGEQDLVRRVAEEHCVDMATACLSLCGVDAPHDSEDPRVRLGRAFAIAVRPPASIPEVSKEAKVAMKKARGRVRMAVLVLLRSIAPAEAPAAVGAGARKPVGDSAPPVGAVKQGTELVTAEEGTLFESICSYDDLGSVGVGHAVTATGPPVDFEGYFMVPIAPKGAIELRILRALAPAPKAAAKAKGGKAGGAGPKGPELRGHLRDLAMAAAGDSSAVDMLEVCRCGFDPAAVLADPAAQAAVCQAEADGAQEEAAPEQVSAPSPAKGKKAGKPKPAEEDLDALLQEFGMTAQAGSSKKKKSKK